MQILEFLWHQIQKLGRTEPTHSSSRLDFYSHFQLPVDTESKNVNRFYHITIKGYRTLVTNSFHQAHRQNESMILLEK